MVPLGAGRVSSVSHLYTTHFPIYFLYRYKREVNFEFTGNLLTCDSNFGGTDNDGGRLENRPHIKHGK